MDTLGTINLMFLWLRLSLLLESRTGLRTLVCLAESLSPYLLPPNTLRMLNVGPVRPRTNLTYLVSLMPFNASQLKRLPVLLFVTPLVLFWTYPYPPPTLLTSTMGTT